MQINRLFLKGFRNYINLDVDFSRKINVFYGKNAQGKSSILEAIYYLSLLSSYRTNIENELINHNNEEFLVAGRYENIYQNHTCKIKKNKATRKRQCYLNEKLLGAKEYIGNFKSVLFSPEDLKIIKGEPATRRRFINIQIAQNNSYYYSLLLKNQNILKQRNKLLKEIREGRLLASQLIVWNEQYAEINLEIIKIRAEFFREFLPLVSQIYLQLTGTYERLDCQYLTNCVDLTATNFTVTAQDKASFLEKLHVNLPLDLKRGSTSLGAHKDDCQFFLNDHDAHKFASQGQQRTIVLCLKLAEILYIHQKAGEYPVLLLDDVLSELDEQKKQKLLAFVCEKLQLFITVTEKELLPNSLLTNSEVDFFQIQAGRVKRDEL